MGEGWRRQWGVVHEDCPRLADQTDDLLSSPGALANDQGPLVAEETARVSKGEDFDRWTDMMAQ